MRELEKCLRYGRKDKKLTQGDLARLADVDTSVIIRLESGIFVPLDAGALRRIASGADLDPTLFDSLYRASFRQELKALRSHPHASPPQAEGTEPGDTVSRELSDISQVIMAMPADVKSSLLKTIRLLVRAQAAELHNITM